ncbi:nicotinamidase-related amidase [Spinactinospora alkalitolerans]|uniref:Nicotinamidase-related amidase n=1 Tax=Spinactinospora alkalitolerans TaxID=687207 RepID=A0A852TU35_9ACTN|nr:cysteine hydrolase [Spinactinospora alkalitolerans]NYE47171.1 nicotinamidase-related amidase [Spinactinospora alkalitolerans]
MTDTGTAPRAALLLLDYQVALCEQGPHTRIPALAEQIAERDVLGKASTVLQTARRSGLFTVHVRLAFDPTYSLRTNRSTRFDGYPQGRAMLQDSPEAQIVDSLKPAEGEPVVDKGCVDPFIGTPLLQVLAGKGIRHILLGGVATNLVVESAARHATDSGLQVTVIEDICASFAADAHQFSMERIMPMFATVRSSAEIIEEMA